MISTCAGPLSALVVMCCLVSSIFPSDCCTQDRAGAHHISPVHIFDDALALQRKHPDVHQNPFEDASSPHSFELLSQLCSTDGEWKGSSYTEIDVLRGVTIERFIQLLGNARGHLRPVASYLDGVPQPGFESLESIAEAGTSIASNTNHAWGSEHEFDSRADDCKAEVGIEVGAHVSLHEACMDWVLGREQELHHFQGSEEEFDTEHQEVGGTGTGPSSQRHEVGLEIIPEELQGRKEYLCVDEAECPRLVGKRSDAMQQEDPRDVQEFGRTSIDGRLEGHDDDEDEIVGMRTRRKNTMLEKQPGDCVHKNDRILGMRSDDGRNNEQLQGDDDERFGSWEHIQGGAALR